MTEDDLPRPFPEVAIDVRLAGRAGGGAFLDLAAEAPVCVVSLSGSFIGCVGDLGLGLTNGGELLEGVAFFSVGFFSAAGVVIPLDSGALPAVFGCVEDAVAGLVAFALSAPFSAAVPVTAVPLAERSLLPGRSRAFSRPLA